MEAMSLFDMNMNEFSVIITMVSNADKDSLLLKPWISNNNGILDKKILALFNHVIIVCFIFTFNIFLLLFKIYVI